MNEHWENAQRASTGNGEELQMNSQFAGKMLSCTSHCNIFNWNSNDTFFSQTVFYVSLVLCSLVQEYSAQTQSVRDLKCPSPCFTDYSFRWISGNAEIHLCEDIYFSIFLIMENFWNLPNLHQWLKRILRAYLWFLLQLY